MSILVVQISEIPGSKISSTLKMAGFGEQSFAGSVESIPDHVRDNEDIDLIIIDSGALTADPLNQLIEIRYNEELKELPIIIICEESELVKLQAVLTCVPIDCLVKPIRTPELVTRVRLSLMLNQEIRKRISNQKNADTARQKVQDIRHMLNKVTNLDEAMGIANRRYFDITFSKEWRRAKRDRKSISLVLIKIDFSTGMSDDNGKLRKSFLKEIGLTINRFANRPGDLVARFDDDEFVVLLPSTKLKSAEEITARIMRMLEPVSDNYKKGDTYSKAFKVRCGTASMVPEISHSIETLLAKAVELKNLTKS